jgi:predicted DsbA family dithiol-disulfide isomerase
MILAFISIFEIKKICALCFVTYFKNLAIALLANSKGFFIQDIITTFKDFIKGAKKYFILFIIVLVSFVSTLVYLSNSLIFSPKLKERKEQKEFFEAKKNKYAVKGNILGKENAKVIINVYSDYNCPYCRIVNIMLHKAAKERNILVNEINFPLDASCNKQIGMTLGGHESSCIYSKYALAAKKQGKFWGVANILFDTHPQNFDAFVEEIKKAKLNLNIEQLQKDAVSLEVANELQEDIEQTTLKGIMGTPTFEINGIQYVGAMPYKKLIETIDIAQKRAEN